ncbi:MAG: glutamyl-tRNA amidotransferase [Dehalococcoidia bacterium]|nr:GatB/YqeY domain-containing protein [Dehalococcoidia bacterium]MCZ7578150.1 GatB/YqeY domain-containing protein [Dehalococcoidia bacterium]PWB41471.1 MAG: glutamyl-tRNA amidotransferase [Dehalococcoidia bacterium]
MATLKDTIQADLADAMRNREEIRKSALRMLIAAIKNAEIDQGKPLDDDAVIAVIQKQVKQRRESILEFEKGNRMDLVERERDEETVLQAYLPEQAGPEEIEAAVRKVIAETGASGPRDIGKVMPVLTRQFAGRADGRAINEVVRRLLGS